jgi:hypothetical protein
MRHYRSAAACLVFLLCASTGTTFAAQCPANIDGDDCVANDLQPTGTEIIEGPSACTEGEIFSAKIRIKFEDGGGANERYTVGFYVGDNGQSPIGGDSCTFDSLQPVGAPIDLTGGSGGFLELSGDACGDISKSDPTYKDIQLDSILCKDEDGDGNVDIGYVLTWENNANQTSCTDPLDPAQFEPAPPKCLSDLDYDLPIEVEQPPSIEVGKGAFPATVREPGDKVIYAITIINTSASASDPVEIVNITDVPYGDITDLTDCVLPFWLARGESVTCNFETEVTGVAGDDVIDVVTVIGFDDEGEEATGSDTATVEIIEPDNPPEPGDLRLLKFATPAQVSEPGGIVQYDVLAANLSPTGVVLTSLVDNLYGDLDGKGSCSLPQTLKGESALYFCAFQEPVTGQPDTVITDIIEARGYDELPARNEQFASASASVTIINVNSDIEVIKVANPATVLEPGGEVEYTLQVQNHSVADEVTIGLLADSLHDVSSGDCETPFTLKPGGETYQCSYTGSVSGNAGDTVTNVVSALGTDDDGHVVADIGAATVTVLGAPPTLEVVKIAIPPVALTTGSPVRYVVGVQNTSSTSDPVTITGMTDTVNGVEKPLDGLGTCDLTPDDAPLVLQPAPSPESFYLCSWVEPIVTGVVGVPLVDTVNITGEDDEATAVQASAQASVSFVEIDPGVARLEMVKIASPRELPEPGGDVTYTVLLANNSDQGDLNLDMTVTVLDDDLYGSLDGKGGCALPIDLPVGAFSVCQFTEAVEAPVGAEVMDTITATATYQDDEQIQVQASATVTITDIPSNLIVNKTAAPTTVEEPGEDVVFSIVIINSSQVDEVEITSLIDNVHGDLNGQGDCAMPQTLAAGESYPCSFTALVSGEPGTEEINTVVATGTDDDGLEVSAQDQANVAILDVPPSITASKTADPATLGPNGGLVTFTFTTTNTSPVDTVEIDSLQDSVFGDLDGQGTCSVPQELEPGASYVCEFEAELPPMPGDTHFDQMLAEGTSDDGDPVAAGASAIVTFLDLVAIPVLGLLGLAVLALTLALFGWLSGRGRM